MEVVFIETHGAGGGAGGADHLMKLVCHKHLLANPTGLTATVASFPITVGAGEQSAKAPGPSTRNPGSNSVFSTITSAGGGEESRH